MTIASFFFLSLQKNRYHLMKFCLWSTDIPLCILRLSFRCPKKDSRLLVLSGMLGLSLSEPDESICELTVGCLRINDEPKM